MKKQNGITMIALVITIIVILILAGVSLSMTSGDKGILTKAQNAVETNQKAAEKEEFDMIVAEYEIITESEELASSEPIKNFLANYKTNGKIKSFEETGAGTTGIQYKVVVENYEFIFPYEESLEGVVVIDKTDADSTTTNTNDNKNLIHNNFPTIGNVDDYTMRRSRFPLLVLADIEHKSASKVKFFIKLENQSDEAYVPATAYYAVGSQQFIGSEMGISSSGEAIAVELDDYEQIYVIKLEYTFTDGSIGLFTYKTPAGLCFVKGTQVLTVEGLMNIEEIEKGMKVYSRNDATGENELKTVLSTFEKTAVVETYKIKVGNEYIESTNNHPFFVKGVGYVEAKDLEVGDVLVDFDNNEVVIENIEILESREITVYNMNVDENHNYFVGKDNILVHNAACP